MDQTNTLLESQVQEHAPEAKPDIFAPDMIMLVLTWVTFLSLLFILQKFAWKPILSALQNREKTIKDSLTQADQIKKELSDVQASKEKVLSDARLNAQSIVDEARKKAVDLAKGIEERAKHQAQEIVQTAHQEIVGERQRAEASLKRESVSLAVDLATKLIQANLDKSKSDKLIEQYLLGEFKHDRRQSR